MNFKFLVGDIVVFSPNSKRSPQDCEMEIVKSFVNGTIFHAKAPNGQIFRVRTPELVRIRRPSDEVRAAEVAKRVESKKVQIARRNRMVEERKQEFSYLEEFRIKLRADGLPDKRYKPRYKASNAPFVLKGSRRRGLLDG